MAPAGNRFKHGRIELLAQGLPGLLPRLWMVAMNPGTRDGVCGSIIENVPGVCRRDRGSPRQSSDSCRQSCQCRSASATASPRF